MAAAVLPVVVSLAALWPASPSRGILSSPAVPVPLLASIGSCKLGDDIREVSAWGEDEAHIADSNNETFALQQPPRRLSDVRSITGLVDPMFNDTSLWSEKLPPPQMHMHPDVVLDWISIRPRMFLWRGFAPRSDARHVIRRLLGPDMDNYWEFNRRRDQWRIPLGKIPLVDSWTQTLREMWPGLKYARDFVTVTRSPPGKVLVNEHFDSHVATAMLYLSDAGDGGGTDHGGWTTFPESGTSGADLSNSEGRRSFLWKGEPRCEHGLQVAPRAGSLVAWYNHYPNSSLDLSAVHASCPTVGRDKWVVVWFVEPYPKQYFGKEYPSV